MDAVGNNDPCGRCEARHGGNNHSCPVHGRVSKGCCEPSCNPSEWEWVYRVGQVNKANGRTATGRKRDELKAC
jgi:hypothetical protein